MTLRDAVIEARMGKRSSLRCPAHEDRSPSLSVWPGRNGGVLIKCHTGCPTESVLAAVGLGWSDVCAPRELVVGRASRPIVAQKARPSLDDDDRREKRAAWPAFELPTGRDLDRIAAVRGLGREGLELAVSRGILWVISKYRGHRSWIVTDSARLAAQARRLDGEKFEIRDGSTKALTLAGSVASWPVGVEALTDNHRAILLTEGGPDLLAAFYFIHSERREHDATAVGILGASCSIPTEVLTRFDGRRVRIAQHADEKGEQAAQRWAGQLGSHVECGEIISFEGLRQHDGKLVEDLNDLAHVHADEFEHHRWIGSITP